MLYNNRVTICTCASRSFIDKEKVVKVAAFLRQEGYDVVVEPDLCEKVRERTSDLPDVASSTIIACYPRAIRSLFASVGMETSHVLDIRNEGMEAILDSFGFAYEVSPVEMEEEEVIRQSVSSFPVKIGVDAWYPTLDKERCTDCGKCHDFCLFGVYTIEDGVVTVKQPQNCKNNCPACARMCPNKAIIFPKYEKSPINGGLKDEELAVSIDAKTVYADTLRARLAQRRAGVSFLKKDNQ